MSNTQQPRFFIDHDCIHDRLTGRHVHGDRDVEPGVAEESVDMLNDLDRRAALSQPAPQGVAEMMELVDLLLHEQLSRVAASEHLGGANYTAVRDAITAIVQERDALKSRIAELRARAEVLPRGSKRGGDDLIFRSDVLALLKEQKMTSFTDIHQKAENTLEYWREACAVRDEQITVLNARVAELEGTLTSVMDSAEEWSGYVEVDHAPMSLVKHLERASAAAKEPK